MDLGGRTCTVSWLHLRMPRVVVNWAFNARSLPSGCNPENPWARTHALAAIFLGYGTRAQPSSLAARLITPVIKISLAARLQIYIGGGRTTVGSSYIGGSGYTAGGGRHGPLCIDIVTG